MKGLVPAVRPRYVPCVESRHTQHDRPLDLQILPHHAFLEKWPHPSNLLNKEHHVQDPILLTDEQMQKFIVDGYLVFRPSVPEDLHERIYRKLNRIIDNETNPGNNVLPRVPEMRHILNCPEVRGALISVLGPDYLEHPHRFCHPLKPIEEIPSPQEREEKLRKNCHQDGYTPLGHPRHHYLRYARIMYYPQDSPEEIGPTHVIPGTQYHTGLSDEDRSRAAPVAGAAGTVSLTHFDIGHAAGVSTLKRHRHMIKFIYVRESEPTQPTWQCASTTWRKPSTFESAYDLDVAWSHFWDWSCGKRDRYESLKSTTSDPSDTSDTLVQKLETDNDLETQLSVIRRLARSGEAASEAVPHLVSFLGAGHRALRIAATYALGAIGEPAIDALVENLRETGEREAGNDPPAPWTEGAISMEDAAHALAAVGAAAISSLVSLMDSRELEWTRINAAFALGELDSQAAEAVPVLIKCLSDDSHRVVRTVVDALGNIRSGVPIEPIVEMLSVSRSGWDTDELHRWWRPVDQVHTSAATVFAKWGPDASNVEPELTTALDDPCGHVGSFALNALQRLGTPSADRAAIDYLMSQRWDPSIDHERLF